MNQLISIIVPVYKAEKFIARCVHSLMQQSYSNIEYIFIDDLGGDNSIQILEEAIKEYPERKEILIIKNECNKGSSESRNIGLDKANGDYVTFCDADDWMEKNALEDLFDHLKSQNADIVWSDFFLSYVDQELIQKEDVLPTSEQCIKAMISEQMHAGLWNKLYAMRLFKAHNIRFPVGYNIWEDMLVNVQLFYWAKKVSYLPKAYYHYVQYNADSQVSSKSPDKLASILVNTQSILDFLKSKENFNAAEILAQLMLSSKKSLLFSTKKSDYRKWKEIFPESNEFVMKQKSLPQYSRLLGQAINHNNYIFINTWILTKKIKNFFSS